MASRKSFEVILMSEGFGNDAISFAYASRIPGRNQPRTLSGVKLLIAFCRSAEQYSFFHVGAIGHSPSPVFSRRG